MSSASFVSSLPSGHNTLGQAASGDRTVSCMRYVVEAFWAKSAPLPTHAWHVGLCRAKELCIHLTMGNKERWKKKFSIAPGYCYLAAAEEFKISLCYSIYSRSLRETPSPRRKAPSHAGIYILTVCKTFWNTPQRVEGGGGIVWWFWVLGGIPVRAPEKQEMAAFVLGRCFNLR